MFTRGYHYFWGIPSTNQSRWSQAFVEMGWNHQPNLLVAAKLPGVYTMDVKFPLLVVGCAERHVQLGDYMSQSHGFSEKKHPRKLQRTDIAYTGLYNVIYEFIVAIVIWIIVIMSLIAVCVVECSSCWLLADAGRWWIVRDGLLCLLPPASHSTEIDGWMDSFQG